MADIYNQTSNIFIYGTDDNDSIYSYNGHYSTISGGTGSDTIGNYYGYANSINGGENTTIIFTIRETKQLS